MRLVLVPPTIQALLEARLDGLSAPERRLLEAGAVEGRVFHLGTAAALCDMPRAEASALLVGMVRKELLRPERATLEGEDAFRFRHILITDAAYAAVPKRARAVLHEQFADLLEARLGDRVAEVQEILGHHLERAFRLRDELGEPDEGTLAVRAAVHLAAAGRRALARGDSAAAVLLLERAVNLVPGSGTRLGWIPDLCWALFEHGRTDDGLRLLADAVAAVSDAEHGLLAHRLRVELILAAIDFGEPAGADDSLAAVRAAEAAAEHAGDPVLLARALTAAGRILSTGRLKAAASRDLGAATAEFERACAAAIRSGDVRVISDAENYLGGIYSWGPFAMDEAVAFCERSYGLTIARDRLLWAYGQANVFARRHAFRGEFDEARALLDGAADQFDELGSRAGWLNVAAIRAEAASLAGDREALAAVLRDVDDRLAVAQAEEAVTAAGYEGELALYWAEIGDAEAAERWLARVPDPRPDVGVSTPDWPSRHDSGSSSCATAARRPSTWRAAMAARTSERRLTSGWTTGPGPRGCGGRLRGVGRRRRAAPDAGRACRRLPAQGQPRGPGANGAPSRRAARDRRRSRRLIDHRLSGGPAARATVAEATRILSRRRRVGRRRSCWPRGRATTVASTHSPRWQHCESRAGPGSDARRRGPRP